MTYLRQALISLVLCLLTSSCASGEHWHEPTMASANASVDIDAAASYRTVPKEIFGTNIEWPMTMQQIWIDQNSAIDPKVIDLSKQMHVSLVRFPGGTYADYYDWRLGIGPANKRPPQRLVLDKGSAVNYFGTDELAAFCRSINGEPFLTVNLITGNAQSAADWVRYCNYDKSYKVRFWELGNESYMKPDKPETRASCLTAQEYSERCRNFIEAMKKTDPSIKIGAIGGNNFQRFEFISDKNWNETILKNLGDKIDFLSVHNGYAPLVMEKNNYTVEEVYASLLAFPILMERDFIKLGQQIDQFSPGNAKRIKIAITEWGPLFHVDPGNSWSDHPKTLGSGLFTASVLHTMLRNPRVEIATFFKLKDVIYLGTIGLNDVPKASFYSFQLYSKLIGQKLVKANTQAPCYDSRALGLIADTQKTPYIDTIAACSADNKHLSIYIINKSLSSSIKTHFTLKNFAPQKNAKVSIFTAENIDSNNGVDFPNVPGYKLAKQNQATVNPQFDNGHPGNLHIAETSTSHIDSQFDYIVLPHSITCLELSSR